jgi:ribosome recycling factor
MNTIEEKKYLFESAITHLNQELDSVRTGRAHPALVENIMVDYYGTKTPLIQLATIAIPDARTILIQPWDKNCTKDIEKALQISDLGLNPVNEGNTLLLPIPALTEERRKELVKIVNQKVEEARVAVRNIREEIWKSIRDQEKTGDISEDEMFRQQKDLQKLVDEFQENIKGISTKKETEIMTI